MTVDYTPLEEPISFSKGQQILWLKHRTGVIAAALLLVTCFIIVIVIASNDPKGFIIVGPALFVLFGIAVYAYSLKVDSTVAQTLLENFTQKNEFELLENFKDPSYAGLIFDEGYNRRVILGFNDMSTLPIEVGNYMYVTGSGKNRHTHTFGYVKMTVPNHLPNIVLDSKKNNFFGISNLPDAYGSAQKIGLEGDFDSFFTVYTPAGYGKDTLYLLTPDVMAFLVDHMQEYDIELIDNELYLYHSTHFNLTSSQQIKDIYTVLGGLGAELGKQAAMYQDERVALSVTAAPIAQEGRRLHESINWVVVVILIVITGFSLIPYFPFFLRL